jgi:hypothetical protein
MAQPDPNPETQGRELGTRLRALPDYTPPSGGWTALQQRMDAMRPRRRIQAALLSMAASVVITLGLLISKPSQQGAGEVAAPASRELAQLMAQSRALESNLALQRQSVAMWDTASAVRAEALQRDLSIVDLQLAYARPASAQRLWRDRVDLLANLLRTHQEAGLSNASYQPPSENEL